MKRIAAVLAVAVLATLVGLAGPQSARSELGCANEATVDSQLHYAYRMCGVPDIDQRRAAAPGILGLPGDGSMWCAPTSAMNWLAFIANSGYPTVPPFPGDWQLGPPDSPDVYNFMTERLAGLGQAMGTTPEEGTKGGMQDGIRLDLFFSGRSEDFVVGGDYASGTHAPVADDLAVTALFGGLVMAGIGRYTNPDTNSEHVRNGGHVVSFVRAVGDADSGAVALLGLHDPATGAPDKVSQSTFSTEFYFTKDVQGLFGWQEDDGTKHLNTRTQSRVLGTESGYLDGYTYITPKFGLTFANDHLVLLKPVDFLDGDAESVRPMAAPGPVTDLAVSPLGSKEPFLVEGSNAVWALDGLTGRVERVAGVPHPRKLVVAGRRLYALLDRKLVEIGGGGPKARVKVPDGIDDVVYDAADNEIVGVDSSSGTLYTWTLELEPMGEPIVDFIEGEPERPVTLGADGDGGIYGHRDGSREVRVARIGRRVSARSIELEGADDPLGLAVDDEGNVYTSDHGMLRVFDSSGRRQRDSSFDGLPAGRELGVLQAFSNFDPKAMNGRAFANLDIESLADV
jgi:hypothetical protein